MALSRTSRVNATGQYVTAFSAGTTTAVINNPYGGAFRYNRAVPTWSRE